MKEYRFKINGREYDVAVNGIENGVADVTVNGKGFNVELESAAEACGVLLPATPSLCSGPTADAPPPLTLPRSRGCSQQAYKMLATRAEGLLPAGMAQSQGAVPRSSNPVADSKGKYITSPLPGVVLDIFVMPGQAVKRGDRLAVIEAMKMENDILAECDGTVSEIYVTKGSPVDEGARLMLIS